MNKTLSFGRVWLVASFGLGISILLAYSIIFGIGVSSSFRLLITLLATLLVGRLIARRLAPISDENILVRALYYTLIGLLVLLFVFFFSNYFESGFVFWGTILFSLATQWRELFQLIKRIIKGYVTPTLDGLLFFLVICLILVGNINRPNLPYPPTKVLDKLVHSHFVYHDYIHEIAIAQLILKDNDVSRSPYVSTRNSHEWGYYRHSPLGFTLVPLFSKFGGIEPALSYSVVTPLFLFLMLALLTYLILRQVIQDKNVSYLGMLLMTLPMPIEHLLGINEFLHHQDGLDRHSLYIDYAFLAPRYFLGHVLMFLTVWLFLRFQKDNEPLKTGLLLGLCLAVLALTRELLFLAAGLGMILTMGWEFFLPNKRKLLLFLAVAASLCIPVACFHFFTMPNITGPNDTIVNPVALKFEYGHLNSYIFNVLKESYGDVFTEFTPLNLSMRLLEYCGDTTDVICSSGAIVLYDVSRGYGLLFILFLCGIIFFCWRLIAIRFIVSVIIILTIFENGLYIDPSGERSDMGIISGLSMNNIEFSHFLATVVALIFLGECYVKTSYWIRKKISRNHQ